MNGNWFTWGYLDDSPGNPHNGNSAAQYIQAFQYMVNKFRAYGATNVKWVWCINASWHDDFSAAFPGTNYVDRLAMNGFNWGDDPAGSSPDWEKWRDFERIFGKWDPSFPLGVDNYNRLAQLGTLPGGGNLPILVEEFGSAPEPVTLAMLAMGSLVLIRRKR